MKPYPTVAGLALALILAGCQPNPQITFTGQSYADERLRRDALNIVSLFFTRQGCRSIENVDSTVLFYEPPRGEEGHVWGKENWVVAGCSTQRPYAITFTEDGRGGTFVGVTQGRH